MNRSIAPRLERSSGCTRLSFKETLAGTAIDQLYQQGCCKVRFPRNTDDTLEAVLLNTAGGLADGDTLDTELRWRSNTRAIVTTQAAERVYRAATDNVARVATRISIEEDCMACWLPQETIVFDGARLERALEIDMASTSRLVALESVVFGRRAMGETVEHGKIADRWRIRLDGRLVFADHFLVEDHLAGHVGQYLDRAAVLNTAHCLATVIIAGNHSEKIVEDIRKLAAPLDSVIGATCFDRLAVLRVLAGDSRLIRGTIGQIIASLHGILDAELPRVWQC